MATEPESPRPSAAAPVSPAAASEATLASCEGRALHEFRATRTRQSLRALGSSLPVLVVALLDWTPTLALLVLISGGVALASTWASVRAYQELGLPLRERYGIVDETLIREVGEHTHTRIPRAKLRTMMLDPHGLLAAGKGRQIFIPRAAVGFDPLIAALRPWGAVHTRTTVVRDASSKLGLAGLVRAALIGLALVYVVIATGQWLGIVIGVVVGLAVAGLARALLGWSARELDRHGEAPPS